LNAHKFVERLALQISTLEQHPERCPSIPENEKVGAMYRHLLYGDYRTLFRVAEKTVLIIRILHGARLLEEAMLELKE
jgi:plasmid stabilization system protein ParE